MGLLTVVFSAILPLSLGAAEPERISISRYFTLKTCYKGASCEGPVARGIGRANVALRLKPLRGGGAHAWDRARLQNDGVRFQSEIHVVKVKTRTSQDYNYIVSVALRSGERESKTLKFYLKDLSDLGRKVIADEPFRVDGGTTMQAQLIIGPQF